MASTVLTISRQADVIVAPGLDAGGSDDAYGEAAFCPTDGTHPADGVRALCRSVGWPPQGEELRLQGPVPVHGVCAADLSREPARHRSVPALAGREALPHGDSRPSRAQHARERQRDARLAYLRRLRSAFDRQRAAIDAVEEGLDVGLQNPVHFAPVHDTVQGSHGVMGAAPRPKAIRAV